MKEEFGKWLMDIAKYVATAVLLTTIFGGMEQKWLICAIASVVILTTLGMGLWPSVKRRRIKHEFIRIHLDVHIAYAHRHRRFCLFHDTGPQGGKT